MDGGENKKKMNKNAKRNIKAGCSKEVGFYYGLPRPKDSFAGKLHFVLSTSTICMLLTEGFAMTPCSSPSLMFTLTLCWHHQLSILHPLMN